MSRPSTPPPADAPRYHYDPHLGSPRDRYERVDFTRTRLHQPELPGRFVAVVDGEMVVNSMWGRRLIKWRAEPGTPCLILGHWADGTVHVKWAAVERNYMIDGRFPAWVVEEDPSGRVAGGGFILRANELPLLRSRSWPWIAMLLVLALALLVVILVVLVPATLEALGGLLRQAG